MILFPSSYFDTSKVDEDLQKEYEAVLATGLFKTAVFGYDKWFNEGKLIIGGEPAEEHYAVYRVVYADKYGYLMGYHDGLAGNGHILEDEYETKFGYESFIIGYDQGYEDAIEGNDSLEDFGGALTLHNVSIDKGEMEETDMKP